MDDNLVMAMTQGVNADDAAKIVEKQIEAIEDH